MPADDQSRAEGAAPARAASNDLAKPASGSFHTWHWRLALAMGAAGLSLAAGEAALRLLRGPAELHGAFRHMTATQLTSLSWPEFTRRQAQMRQACRAQGMERARSHSVLEFSYNPGFRLDMDGVRLSINSHGLRGEEFPIQRPADEFRVLCLGGSTTAGEEVSDDQTYPALLQSLLTARFPERRIRVINAGVPSYDTRQSWLDFSLRLWRFDPQVVTIYHGINDLPEFGQLDHEIAPKPNYAPHALSPFVCDGDAAPLSWREYLSAVARPLAGKSHLLSLGKSALGHVRPARPKTLAGCEAAGVATFAAFYRALLRDIAGTGALPLPITFAVAWPGEFSPEERQKIEASFAIWIAQSGSAWGRTATDQQNEAVRQLCRELELPLCEAVELPASAETFVDACHLTAAGHAWLADRLCDSVAPRVESFSPGVPDTASP